MTIINKTSLENVNQYLSDQYKMDRIRFITCGSVDDGKSTLIGRMLFESQMIFDDQILSLKNESKKIGTQGNDFDFALLVDGLVAEREQGITIDVAYRYFSTERRKFIVADTPGHEQYTRNMVTGASTADLAIILIDAQKGILTQTRRHSMICSTLGIKNIVLAINKMDLVGYSEKIFKNILKNYMSFCKELKFELIIPIPISALKGDNIIQRSQQTKWFKGPTLMHFLETVDIRSKLIESPFRLPIQWVNRPNQNFRGFSGTVESGQIKVGQKISVLPSGETANIKEILLFKNYLNKAHTKQAITVTLDRDIDISRGDVLVDANSPSEVSDQFEIKVIWMDSEPGYSGRSYLLKLGTSVLNAQITNIKHKININTFAKLSTKKLEFNDLSVITISTDKPITFENYYECKGLGGLILIDKVNNQTVAAGMINFALRRASNIHKYNHEINKYKRQILNGHPSKVIWLTGLSGSGKSTIANALEKKLYSLGIRTYVLDGDNIRHGLNKDLGFNNSDRVENIRRVSEVAKLMVDAGIVVITAFISPFNAERKMARSIFNDDEFLEVYLDIPLRIAEMRDPKGLYKKARKGDIPNFTGIDSPYEEPKNPDLRVKTDIETVDDIIKTLIEKIGIKVEH